MQIPSTQQLQALSSECASSTNPQYAAERAQVLFGCYRKGEANDPETYVAAVAAVLAQYPADTIRYVTDPRTGIPSKVKWMPNVGEVRQACEDHYGPTRRAVEREAAERRQLAERRRLEPPAGPRRSYEELIESCRAAGLDMGGQKKSAPTDINAFLAEHGVTREQFDAMPDAPGYRWK